MRNIKYKPLPDNLRNMVAPISSNSTSRTSLGLERSVGEYFYISVDDLIPFANQARKNFSEEDINSLAASITQYGVRQPLTVIASSLDTSKYEVVSGERRLRAAKVAGLLKVPCIITKDASQSDAIALIENIHRTDLHPIELGMAYKTLLDKGIFHSQAELASSIATNEQSVSENLKYAELPEAIREKIIKDNITSRDRLRALVKAHISGSKAEISSLFSSSIQEKKDFSVMRIRRTTAGMQYQMAGLGKLNSKERDELKKYLTDLLAKL